MADKKYDITIHLVDVDNRVIRAWERKFFDEGNVRIVNMDVVEYLEKNSTMDGVVSAANSFGIMTGGIDAAYIQYFGSELQEAVQRKIAEEYFGEQPVGTSVVVEIPNYPGILLIHTPSMRTPQPIIDPRIVYSCTRTALVEAIRCSVKNLILPAFGHLTGKVPADIVSELMYRAYQDVFYNNAKVLDNSFDGITGIDDVLIGHFIWK